MQNDLQKNSIVFMLIQLGQIPAMVFALHTNFKFCDIVGNLWEKTWIFFSVFILMQYVKENQEAREERGREERKNKD